MTTSLGWGGTEGHVTDLAIGYAALGIPFVVAVDMPPLDRLETLKRRGIRVEILTEDAGISPSNYVKSLDATLKELKPDLIHLNSWARKDLIFKVTREAGIPVVETLHTTISNLNLKTKVRYFFPLRRERQAYRKTLPAVINISDLSLHNFRRLYPFIDKTARVYCGAYFPKEPNDVISRGASAKVLWIGSMIERKRPVWALEIWKRLVFDFPGSQLIMVGNGPEMDRVKSMVQEMPPEMVLLSGNIADLSPVLKMGDIMFHTSVAEGIPKNIRYALNFGMPVIATNAGAISEAVTEGENGFLTEPHDESLTEKRLRQLISDATLRGVMGIKGREWGNRIFRMDNMVSNVLRAYKDLCGVEFIPKYRMTDRDIYFPLD